VLIVLVLVGSALATHHHHGGHSSASRKQDDHGNYAFKYDIKNGHGAVNGRQEHGSPHHVVGSYYLGDIDGRHRTVHYVADKAGFRAQVKTNEPGTRSSYAAAAHYHSGNGQLIPSGSHHAPFHHGYHGHHGVIHNVGVHHGPRHYGFNHGGHHGASFHHGHHGAPFHHGHHGHAVAYSHGIHHGGHFHHGGPFYG